ncbi:MAG: hypothetical protein ACKV0T_24785 [Planctomycetales bacterium]
MTWTHRVGQAHQSQEREGEVVLFTGQPLLPIHTNGDTEYAKPLLSHDCDVIRDLAGSVLIQMT